MAAVPALLLRNLAQTDGLVVAGLQRFLGLEDQLAEPHRLQQVPGEQEGTGHYSPVVVGDIRRDDVRSYRYCQQQQDEQVDAVVPVLREVRSALREVANDPKS